MRRAVQALLEAGARRVVDDDGTRELAADGYDLYVGGIEDSQPVALDPDGRAHAYIVLWGEVGQPIRGRACASPSRVEHTITITCAGGDMTRAEWAVARVRAQLSGVYPLVSDGRVTSSPLIEVLDPGSVRKDDTVHPPRWYTALQFAVTEH